ncbi:uncharacterized protein KGF55_004933 [Candida pseudojiufengensis]|uniref:uncharacterized protein n=1 Tax=Candida pseudojiufengensis TaxID=497109 RepID=UPI0022254697|nr:uncharacterized protein KGF55_004933 [Candida pseudojiufengensis]KAI5960210.1 hypothetical protein KGF55_004933 [Candida pseudojiufengensis]
MSGKATINNLIAHYLKTNNYPKTLKQFEEENGKPIDSNLDNPSENSLRSIIQDRLIFNSLSSQFQNTSINSNDQELIPQKLKFLIDNEFTNWNLPYPHIPDVLDIHPLIISSAYDSLSGTLYFTTNDSQIIIKKGNNLKKIKFQEIIKKILVFEGGVLLLGMSGYLYLKDFNLENVSDETPVIQTQSRFTVDAKVIKFEGTNYVVTLAFNNILKLIKIDDNKFEILDELKLDLQGTCFDLTIYQNQIVIVVGKLENTLLDVYTITNFKFKLHYKISINDAEFTTSSFSPRYVTFSNPSNKTEIPIIAVATSHDPFMRIILVSLIDFESPTPISRNQILKNYNTLSPQDKFSQPLISWRYHNNKISGIWVMGDDGTIRGLDVLENKIIKELKPSNESRGHKTKIKDFIHFIDKDGKENLVTSGIDRQVIEWKS